MPRRHERRAHARSLVVRPAGAQPYAVRFEPQSFAPLPGILERVAPGRRAVLLTDKHVRAIHGQAVENLLGAAREITRLVVPAGEQSKSVAQLVRLWDALVRARIDRTVPLVALGGGVVGDLGGFLAATYLRGIPLIQVPTTLLAQVDSSVGGKTGIDHALGKNLIGAFYQPAAVLANLSSLATLPEREYRAGLAEVVKSAVLADAGLFRALERGASRILEREPAALGPIVRRSVEIKAAVVGRDPLERGERATLNLGHTLAHALEQLAGYRGLRHGEAVSIGLAAAARLSAARGWLTTTARDRICALLARLGLPTTRRGLLEVDLLEALVRDKKGVASEVRFVAPVAIGQVRLEWISADRLAAELAAAAC